MYTAEVWGVIKFKEQDKESFFILVYVRAMKEAKEGLQSTGI